MAGFDVVDDVVDFLAPVTLVLGVDFVVVVDVDLEVDVVDFFVVVAFFFGCFFLCFFGFDFFLVVSVVVVDDGPVFVFGAVWV